MKRYGKLTWKILAANLSIILLFGCVSRDNVKVPLSDPMPHPMLAQMQSMSIEEKDGATYFGESRKYNKRGVTVVVLKGEPYELGYARGVLLKPEIQSWVRDGLYMIKRYAMGTSLGDTLMANRAKEIEKYIPQEQAEEIRGLSAGSGVEYEALLVMITSPDHARVYEYNDENIEFMEMDKDYMILTNHTRLLKIGYKYPNSENRFREAESFLTNNDSDMNVKKLVELNRGKHISQSSNLYSNNLHSVILKPETLEFWIAVDPPPASRGRWVGFNLKTELEGKGNEPNPLIIE